MKTVRRIALLGIVLALVGLVLLPLDPVVGKPLKLAVVACVAVVWLSVTALVASIKPLRIAMLALPFAVVLFLVLPGQKIDQGSLRRDYVRRMTSFMSTNYVWGGESKRGIDCSGLPRRAFRDALLSYGLRHANPGALRAYLEQWWYDASARALGEGYRAYTVPVGVDGTIKGIDGSRLLPGDLAVTKNGLHVLEYLGGEKWIQADPDAGRVITVDSESSDNHWLQVPVTIHRWRLLD